MGVPQHVLRFWETRFPQLQPLKRGGGRRYYRPADMALLETIRAMLHDQGLTIRGAQQALAQRKPVAAPAPPMAVQEPVPAAPIAAVTSLSPDVRAALMGIRERLVGALAA